jgi:hypothetical protein
VTKADVELDIMPVRIFDRALRTPPRTHSLGMLLLQVALVRFLKHRAMKKLKFAHFLYQKLQRIFFVKIVALSFIINSRKQGTGTLLENQRLTFSIILTNKQLLLSIVVDP